MGKPGPLSSQGVIRRLPSAYRLLPELERSSLSSVEEGLADRLTLREAFRRGATELDATRLILARLSARRRREAWDAQDVGLGRFALGQRLELQGGETVALTAVRLEAQLFEQEIAREFSSLPAHSRTIFADHHKDAAKQEASNRATHRRVWPLYYRRGYDDPAGTVFSQIEPVTLLGHRVDRGVHKKCKEQLDKLTERLERIKPGLAAEVGRQFRGVLGFSPRTIAPKQTKEGGKTQGGHKLSNHAFGLAIDIDATWNPHVKDADVIKVLNRIVQGSGWDFGKRNVPIPPAESTSLPEAVKKTYELAHNASEMVKVWLAKHLPVYRKELQQLYAATQGKLVRPSREPVPATPKLLEDELTLDPEVACTPEQATARFDKLLKDSQDLRDLHTVSRYHTQKELSDWMTHGIQNLPLVLVIELCKLGFKWGQTYTTSKDAMHFELEGLVPPESAPRPLEAILDNPERESKLAGRKGKRAR